MRKTALRIVVIALVALPVLMGSLIIAPNTLMAAEFVGPLKCGLINFFELDYTREGCPAITRADPKDLCAQCNSGGACPPPCI